MNKLIKTLLETVYGQGNVRVTQGHGAWVKVTIAAPAMDRVAERAAYIAAKELVTANFEFHCYFGDDNQYHPCLSIQFVEAIAPSTEGNRLSMAAFKRLFTIGREFTLLENTHYDAGSKWCAHIAPNTRRRVLAANTQAAKCAIDGQEKPIFIGFNQGHAYDLGNGRVKLAYAGEHYAIYQF